MSTATADLSAPALELRGIVKRFGALVAVDRVDLVVRRGTVHAVLGENGAGKSTTMRIAYGLLSPDAGEVHLFGSRVRQHSVSGALRAGVGMVQQHASIVPSLSVVENLVLGGRGVFHPAEAAALLRQTMDAAGLRVPEGVFARELDIVDQQRLEILKALAHGAKLLILDEPTAVLAPSDTRELLRWVREFADRGGSVVLVTHKLREALSIADDVTVLRRGRVTHSSRAGSFSEQALASAMFPEAESTAGVHVGLPPSDAIVIAGNLQVTDARGVLRVRGASFRILRHEIVGIAGVEGAGHRELLAALAGLVRPTQGELRIPARRALIPADRLRAALVPEFSLTENVALHNVARRRGIMPWQELTNRTATLIDRFAINAPSPGVLARSLSGGNQQRLVVARELDGDVDLVVADNPTRGLDIRASAFVHDQIRAAASRAAVVVHTPDVDELLVLATRVLVVFNGSIREVTLEREVIGRAMIGADLNATAV